MHHLQTMKKDVFSMLLQNERKSNIQAVCKSRLSVFLTEFPAFPLFY